MRRGRAGIVMVAAALLVGAVAPARGLQNDKRIQGEVRSNEALIYIVRLGEWAGKARTEKFFLEEHLVGVLPNNSYTFTYATPGTRLFWGSFHKDAVFLDLGGGQTYYLVFKVTEFISSVPEAAGKAAIEKVEHYRTISDEDQVKGTKEGLEKWPGYRQKYAGGLAVAADNPTYAPPASTEGLTKVSSSVPISVELMENVSSGANKVGDPVWVRVTEDVVVDAGLFVQKGTIVNARVRDVKGVGGFGRQGKMDVALLSVTASDGTVSPLVGRIDDQGRRKSTDLAFFAGGLLGAFLVKGGEAFSAAGEAATAYLREDVWFKPAETTPATPVVPDDAETVGSAIAGGAVRCELVKGKGPVSVDVILDTTDDIARATLVQVEGNPLPTPVEAIQVSRSKAGLAAAFGGWDICRYLRPSRQTSESAGGNIQTSADNGGISFGLRLVTKDGITVHANLNAQLSPQQRK
jgi:hypothetical protein